MTPYATKDHGKIWQKEQPSFSAHLNDILTYHYLETDPANISTIITHKADCCSIKSLNLEDN